MAKRKIRSKCKICGKRYYKDSPTVFLCSGCESIKAECIICGKEIGKYKVYNAKMRLVCSHDCRAIYANRNPEKRKKQAESMTRGWKEHPERWAGVVEALKAGREKWENIPGERERLGQLSRDRWNDEEYKKNTIIAIRKAVGTDEVKRKKSIISRKHWENPEYSEKCKKNFLHNVGPDG